MNHPHLDLAHCRFSTTALDINIKVGLRGSCLHLWLMKVDPEGLQKVPHRIIELETLFPIGQQNHAV